MGTSEGIPAAIALLFAASLAHAQTTSRISVAPDGIQANADCLEPAISGDGRFVGFESRASNLVHGDTNGIVQDAFVCDRRTGAIELVSLSSGGVQGNGDSSVTSLSADGRFVAFLSLSGNLVPMDSNGSIDLFVRDRRSGTTELVDVSSSGVHGEGGLTGGGSLSADGRFVAFATYASNLVPGDTNDFSDVFVRDRRNGTTERVSVSSAGVQGNDDSGSYEDSQPCAISADGRFVAFSTYATNLVGVDSNGGGYLGADILVHDRLLGTTELASVSTNGVQGNAASVHAAISADGRFVAFESRATNLDPAFTGGFANVFVRDRALGTTELVSRSTGRLGGNENSGISGVAISADGRFVAYSSRAENLVRRSTNSMPDVFVRDRSEGTTTCASLATGGGEGNSWSGIYGLALSADGRTVAFESDAATLVAGDTNGFIDVFVHDGDTTQVPLLCEPGRGGVSECPCANPASGAGRGCDDSAATGGATLAASGTARLSADDLAFAASGMPSNALGVLVQGDRYVLAGVAYGQGIRCVGGRQLRLFSRMSTAGSITVPDLAAGEASIARRSASMGDRIDAGETRWYLVLYRDPIVLGACAPGSTFNATPTRQATWAP